MLSFEDRSISSDLLRRSLILLQTMGYSDKELSKFLNVKDYHILDLINEDISIKTNAINKLEKSTGIPIVLLVLDWAKRDKEVSIPLQKFYAAEQKKIMETRDLRISPDGQRPESIGKKG
jgi:hypothetical protein